MNNAEVNYRVLPENYKNLQPELVDLLSKQFWKINQGNYQTFLKIILEKHAINCTVLDLDNLKKAQILKRIQNMDFKKLKHLTLTQNNISNVQALSLINAINIQIISLEKNHIACIKSLRKLVVPNLKSLALAHNPTRSNQPITQIYKKNKRINYTLSFATLLELRSNCQPLQPDLNIVQQKSMIWDYQFLLKSDANFVRLNCVFLMENSHLANMNKKMIQVMHQKFSTLYLTYEYQVEL